MHTLFRKFNYRNIRLVDEVNAFGVEVLRSDGSFEVVIWLGFIHREQAKREPNSKPVMLRVSRADGYDLSDGEYVQGCWTPRGVYGVFDSKIAIIKR